MSIVSKFESLNLLEPSGPAIGPYRDSFTFTRRNNTEDCFVCDVLIEPKKRLSKSCYKIVKKKMKFGKTVCFSSDAHITATLRFCLQHLTTRKPMYCNLILRGVRATTVAGEKQ